MNEFATTLALAVALSIAQPPAPTPTLALDPQDHGNWVVQWPTGSQPNNYVWHIQSAPDAHGPWADEEQWGNVEGSNTTFYFRPSQPTYFFRLHGTLGTTNTQT